MDGELAVFISLATHGTEWLARPGSAPAPDLTQTQSAFTFVSSVQFPSGPRSRWHKASPPHTASAWLTELRHRGVRRLWLYEHDAATLGDLAPHIAASFANGATWLLVAEGSNGVEAWTTQWTFNKEASQSPGSWSVEFHALDEFHGRPGQPSIEQANAGLDEQLRFARDFAAHESLETWESLFAKALEESTEIPYHPDLVPADYPMDATRLMSKAARSWVWGGMGSWNDLGFEGDAGAEHARISADLYAANCHAFLAATNVNRPT